MFSKVVNKKPPPICLKRVHYCVAGRKILDWSSTCPESIARGGPRMFPRGGGRSGLGHHAIVMPDLTSPDMSARWRQKWGCQDVQAPLYLNPHLPIVHSERSELSTAVQPEVYTMAERVNYSWRLSRKCYVTTLENLSPGVPG